jgi:hypothetical protein
MSVAGFATARWPVSPELRSDGARCQTNPMEAATRSSLAVLCIATALAIPSFAAADPWKDESGHGRWRGEYRDDFQRHRGGYGFGGRYGGHYAREYKHEYRRGGCKYERKWERGGEYKEEVKCK